MALPIFEEFLYPFLLATSKKDMTISEMRKYSRLFPLNGRGLQPSYKEPTEKVAPFRTGLHKLTLI